MRRPVRAVVVAIAGALSLLATPTAHGATAAPVLGDYATPLVGAADANGVKHIDAAATVAKLSAAHINNYSYLIYDSPLYGTGTEAQITQAQWNDLPAFATAAANAGIDVRVYLVPPTESTSAGYKPYGWDYKAWANAIAGLVAAHPNIREMDMDDFVYNTVEGGSTMAFRFTPAYVSQMMTAARQIAPTLKFRPVFYYPQVVGLNAVLPAYRPVVDGILFPYRDEATSTGNTTDPSDATREGNVISGLARCHGGAHCAQIEFPKGTTSAVGQYGAVSQTVAVTAGSTKTLTFWLNDDYNGATTGNHRLQALIDGTVVWDSDVAAASDGRWHQASVNVTAALAGKTSATLTFRVYDAKPVSNFHVNGQFDDVAGTGFTVSDGGFENSSFAPWTASTNTGNFTVTLVPTLGVDMMTYTARLGRETAPATHTYVENVLGQVLALMHAGTIDGSVVYDLNLTGVDDDRSQAASYTSVQNAYGSY